MVVLHLATTPNITPQRTTIQRWFFVILRYNVLMIGRNEIHNSAMLRPDISKRKVKGASKKNLQVVDNSRPPTKIEVKTPKD